MDDNRQRLNQRQGEVLRLVSKGLRNAEIGAQLGLTERTIKMYVAQLFGIFDVTNRTELVGLWMESRQESNGACRPSAGQSFADNGRGGGVSDGGCKGPALALLGMY